MDVTETLLPGVGIRYEFSTRAGVPMGVIALREGGFEIVLYDRDDPDSARDLVVLTAPEADTLAEILGAPRIVERFADLSREVPGLTSARVQVPAGSAFDGRPLGETRARTRTGASVVAIVRGPDVIASPPPDETLHAGDRLVVIGSRAAIEGVEAILAGPPSAETERAGR
jgi:TrkA domain protein